MGVCDIVGGRPVAAKKGTPGDLAKVLFGNKGNTKNPTVCNEELFS